jgi:hypothetical protein
MLAESGDDLDRMLDRLQAAEAQDAARLVSATAPHTADARPEATPPERG